MPKNNLEYQLFQATSISYVVIATIVIMLGIFFTKIFRFEGKIYILFLFSIIILTALHLINKNNFNLYARIAGDFSLYFSIGLFANLVDFYFKNRRSNKKY